MHRKRVSRSESICPLQEVPATFSSDTGGQSDRSQRPSGQGGGRGPPPARLTPAQTRTGPLPCPSPTSRHPTPGLSPTPGPGASTPHRASAPTSAPGSSSASPRVSPGSSAPGFPRPDPPSGIPRPSPRRCRRCPFTDPDTGRRLARLAPPPGSYWPGWLRPLSTRRPPAPPENHSSQRAARQAPPAASQSGARPLTPRPNMVGEAGQAVTSPRAL